MSITYKCPQCGASMEFDGKIQKLKCEHCGFEIGVEEYEREYEGGSKEQESSQENEGNSKNAKFFHCQSCGAQLVTDEFTSAVICGFCGNPSLVEERLEGEFRPSLIIPFTIEKEEAKDRYRKWLKKGPLTPKRLSSESTIEKLSGLYAPFWLYDYTATDNMEATATNVRVERHGDYEYVYTDHYAIRRSVKADFEKIPADASEKMPDKAMDQLEPFSYQELKPFKMPYLSGYLSERYNYSADQLTQRAEERVNQYITDITRSTIKGYSTVTVLNNDIIANRLKNEYALFPVWMLNYRYNNRDYQFILNGQTGKIVANRPISITKAVVWYFISTFLIWIVTMIGGLLIK